MSEWQRVAQSFGTDKGTHTYMPVYERFLGPLTAQDFETRLLELGVGNGESLRMWLHLFPRGRIYALDYRDCCLVHDPRLTVHRRFQQDPAIAFLFEPLSLDAIIDDGGHRREWQRASRDILWPCLKEGGYYFIEDILTDSWPEEMDHWRSDPDCVCAEENKKDVFGNYHRADAMVVLRKRGERTSAPPTADATLRNPAWKWFFHHVESLADPPFTGRLDHAGGAYWGWLEKKEFWWPLWLEFSQALRRSG
jgi:hypothetical protein